MSDIRYNQWLHNSGTGGVSQDAGGNIGIGTTAPLIPVGVGNTSILNVGVVTANYIYGTVQGAIEGTLDDWIVHDGDNNTKFGFPAADTYAVETGGSERLRIDSSGRLLLGTTTVGRAGADELTIGNASGDIGITLRSGTTNEGNIYFADSTTAGNAEQRGIIRFDHDDDSMQFFTASGNNWPTEKLRIKATGLVGINSTSPAAFLDIGAHTTATPTLNVRNHTAAGGFSGNYGSEFRHAYNAVNHCMLIHTQEASNARRVLDISDSNGIFATFTNGKFGLGTTSPGLKFHLQDGALSSAPTPNSNCDMVVEGTTSTGIQFLSSAQTQIRFGDAGSTAAGAIIYQHSGDNFKLNYSNSGALTFNNGSGEVARFLSGGEMVIGHTASTFGSALLSIEKTSTSIGPRINLYNGQASATNATCEIHVGQNYRDANRIIFGRENNNNWASSAAGTASFTSFWTNNAGTIAERMRITALGEIKINETGTGGWNSTAAGVVHIRGNDMGNGLLRINDTNGSSNQCFVRFQYNDHGSNCGGIRRDGTSQSPEFFTGSDKRIKTNIADMPNVLDKINQVKIKTWELKSDSDTKGTSPIAQDLASIFPSKVTKTDDGTGDTVPDGVEPWSIGNNFTWELIKAVQELSAEVETLKTKVSALES